LPRCVQRAALPHFHLLDRRDGLRLQRINVYVVWLGSLRCARGTEILQLVLESLRRLGKLVRIPGLLDALAYVILFVLQALAVDSPSFHCPSPFNSASAC
jgi:hypothetical protein